MTHAIYNFLAKHAIKVKVLMNTPLFINTKNYGKVKYIYGITYFKNILFMKICLESSFYCCDNYK